MSELYEPFTGWSSDWKRWTLGDYIMLAILCGLLWLLSGWLWHGPKKLRADAEGIPKIARDIGESREALGRIADALEVLVENGNYVQVPEGTDLRAVRPGKFKKP